MTAAKGLGGHFAKVSLVCKVPDIGGGGEGYLNVGNGRVELAGPVDEAVAAENQPLLVKADKCLRHGPATAWGHGKGLTIPVQPSAKPAQLVVDAAALSLFPLPHTLKELGRCGKRQNRNNNIIAGAISVEATFRESETAVATAATAARGAASRE